MCGQFPATGFAPEGIPGKASGGASSLKVHARGAEPLKAEPADTKALRLYSDCLLPNTANIRIGMLFKVLRCGGRSKQGDNRQSSKETHDLQSVAGCRTLRSHRAYAAIS